ncbi:unnamed protein product [Amaranthus hypochondriacus]
MKTKGSYHSSGSKNSSGGPHHLNDSVSVLNSPKESMLVRYLRSGIPSDLDYSSPNKSRTIVNYHKSGSSKGSNSTKSPLSTVQNLKDDVLVIDGILVESTNSASKSFEKYRLPAISDSSLNSGGNLYRTEFCMPCDKENIDAYRYNHNFQLAYGQEEKRQVPNRVRNKNKWNLMASDPYYSPQSSTYSPQSSTYNSPQSISSKFVVDRMVTPSPPKQENSKLNKALRIQLKDTSTDWSPLDDGIAVNLPSTADKTLSRKAIDDHINSVLYGPNPRKRLSYFVDISST